MRTTINLDDKAHELASLYASARGITLGDAISEMIQLTQETPRPSRIRRSRGGFPYMPSRGVKITTEIVKKLEAEMDE
jgi:hypothetical protein